MRCGQSDTQPPGFWVSFHQPPPREANSATVSWSPPCSMKQLLNDASSASPGQSNRQDETFFDIWFRTSFAFLVEWARCHIA